MGVNGAFDSAATVDMDCPSAPGSVVKDVLIEGEGNAVDKGQTTLLRTTSFDSRPEKIVSAYNSGGLRLAEASKKGLGGIVDDLVDVKKGSRLVFKRPGSVDGNRQSAEIIVVGVFDMTAQGKEAPAPNLAPPGIPSLSVVDDGSPTVRASGQPIPELAVIPFVEGSGGRMSKGDALAVQYAICDTKGQIVDTTWNSGKPVKLKLDKTMRGLAEGFVDQKVGSCVAVFIPVSFAQGKGNRIVVVDILGILSSSPGKEETATL